MSSIDQRVVQMKFDNAQFEQGVKTTLTSLESLNKGLKLEGATKGLSDVSAAAKGFSLANIASGVESISDKFKALSIIGITALANITTQAIATGQQLLRSLTVEPIRAGLAEYETNLNSIQTILSNTQWQNTGLADVNKALQELNLYADRTIYNFSEMARNIGTFTAAGVKLEVSVNAIKGIANLAAISGSNAEQASTAMYQLSQALATGTVKLMDWNSVVNAGMGGKVFQDALIETARVHHVAVDSIIKEQGSFRDSLQKGWLTSQILTETLAKFTGDLTAAQLKTMGYNDKQIVGILKMGQTAQDAATKIKTFSQLLNTLQEAAGSGWAQTWQLIFGDFEEAKSLFSDVYKVLGGFITASANARNEVLGDWKELGGRTVVIQAIGNAFNALIAVMTPIKEAFHEIFPAATGKQLYDLSVVIRDFTKSLKIGADVSDKLKRTFAGLFAVLGIGWDITKELAFTLFKLFGVATSGSGSFLEVTAKVGDFLVALRAAIQEGHGLQLFFGRLANFLTPPLRLIGLLGKALEHLFDKFDPDKAAKKITGILAKIEPLTRLGDIIATVWGEVISGFGDVWKIFYPIAQKIGQFFANFGTWITSGFTDINYQNILSTINTGLFAGLVLLVKQFFGKFRNGGDGFLGTIKESIEGLTKTFAAMQNTLRAATLLQIAAAIGIMTVSVVALSKIDSDGLTRALTAMTVMFTQLFASMAIFEKMAGSKAFLKMPFVTGALILLAIAVDLLTLAVKNLSTLDWNGLAKGLVGLTVILGGLVATVQLMPNDAKMISTSIGLVILAGAIKLLVSSVTDLSGLSWQEMAKGLTGVAALLAALTLYTMFAQANATGIISGAGIVLLATGIKILASAVADFAKMSWTEIGKGLAAMAGGLTLMAVALIAIPPSSILSAAAVLIVAASLGMIADALEQMGNFSWEQIGKGLTALAGALVLIGTAISLIPPTAPLSAAGILIVAVALGMIGDALGKMGDMSWEQIAKGLVTLAVSLGIITAALILLPAALPGAVALLIVAGALTILTAVLLTLGNMEWSEIIKGLVALAAVFVVLGLAGLLLGPVVPTLLSLGVAVTLLGLGLALAGAGVLAFAIGLTALSVAGAAGAAAIVAIAAAIIGLIPMLVQQIGIALILLIKIIAEAAPQIVEAAVKIIIALLDGIAKIAPKLTEAIIKLLDLILKILIDAIPKMVDAGYKIIIGILQGIANNINKAQEAAANVIVKFLKGIGDNLPKVVQAGIDLILAFVRALTKAIDDNSAAMGKAGADLGIAIIKGMVKGLLGGSNEIINAAKNIAKKALDAAMHVLGVNSPSKEFEKIGQWSSQGLANGLENYADVVAKASENVAVGALDSVRKSISGLSELVASDIDMNPTITPVLDLTSFRKDATQIGGMFSGKTISVDATYSKASAASAGYQSNVEVSNANNDNPDDRPADITFIQNNTSPKALSAAEIYRLTKNQLSKAKEVVAA